MTKEEIAAGRRREGKIKEPQVQPIPPPYTEFVPKTRKGFWRRLFEFLFGSSE
jgi:hypothetical protein